MAISTYAELQTAMANWLSRADLSARIPEFISLGESRINREVRSKQQEERTTGTTTTYITLPADFLSMRSLWITVGGGIRALEYLPPDALLRMYASGSGAPRHFTIIGDEVRFGPDPDSAYDYELWYYKLLPALSGALNTLFTINPDLYLYAAMTYAVPFMKQDARVMQWEQLYQGVRTQINRQDSEGRRSTAMQTVAM